MPIMQTVEYKNAMNVPLAVIIASFIIIIITSGMTDSNGLSALIGGYSGLLLGLLFITILKYPPYSWIDFVPFVIVMAIISLMIFYLATYFDAISSGQVSGYYGTFSTLSTLFLATQIIILVMSVTDANSNANTTKLLSDKMFALLGLFGAINFLLVITIGIVLHFYSTQG